MSSRKQPRSLTGNYGIPSALKSEIEKEYDISESMVQESSKKDSYKRKQFNRDIDINLDNLKSYKEVMNERVLEREEKRVKALVDKNEDEFKGNQETNQDERHQQLEVVSKGPRKRRWDVTPEEKEKELQLMRSKSPKLQESQWQDKIPTVSGVQLTEEVLNKILPNGYRRLSPPAGYRIQGSSSGSGNTAILDQYQLPSFGNNLGDVKVVESDLAVEIPGINGLLHFKEEDKKFFGKLINHELMKDSSDEKQELKVLQLLLKIKNGNPVARKKSMRQITDNAKSFGPKLLFNQILPMLIEPNLESQERHIFLKLVGRLLLRMDDLIRPYAHKILVVVSPLIIDEDFSIRLEAREIISSLSRSSGLATMISSIRPDIDHADEYVRNITARISAIVCNTLGLVRFLPFLKAVIKSKKNWMARHTGIKIVQQLTILLGSGNGNTILPFTNQLIDVMIPGLSDEMLQVRVITALTISQLADTVNPFGMASFEPVLEPAWRGIRKHRGRGLASFVRCLGSIVSLMSHDPNYEEYVSYYTKDIMKVIKREFSSPDEEMKKTILRTLQSLPLSKQVSKNFQVEIINPFFKNFWNRRIAADSHQFCKSVVDTTTTLALKLDYFSILDNIIIVTKDDNESLRRMAIEALHKMITSGSDNLIGLDSQTETKLVDGALFAFQKQSAQSRIYLSTFRAICKAIGSKLKPHLNSIISTSLFWLRHKTPEVRQQSADLIGILAPTIKLCDEVDTLMMLILVLYESLGEVYPDVLGSIISALYSCVNSVDAADLYTMSNPSVNQLLPNLTPILKNRHDKVQESCIGLVGLIARKNPETISAKEWIRICFELLDMLKSAKKRIRIAANDTFGFIAKTIGPQDVLVMLLNNLRVQERQLRVCTAVAIGIVADNCAPFTVLPALMNDYRIPEKNVQNGVLKAMSFLFEYIDGNMTKDYLLAVTPLLEDALSDRDLVHRQTAATVIKHMALNCIGLTNDDYYDVFVHYLNMILPNIYETSPHVIGRVLESIDALRIVMGTGSFSNYIWAGLFHPARKVRQPYWKIYNAAYSQNSDAMVPYYPRIECLPDQPVISYNINELDLFI